MTPRAATPMTRAAPVLALAACIAPFLLLPACAARRAGPYAPASEAQRDSAAAAALNAQGAALLDRDPIKAEALFRRALTADLFCGPAHNNLGVVYLKQGKLFEAAGEFEWARKLMPGHPDPRRNLALALERGGRTGEALAEYESALEVCPGHLPTIQAMALLRVRAADSRRSAGDAPGDAGRTAELLREVSLRGESARWRDWARVQALRLEGREPADEHGLRR